MDHLVQFTISIDDAHIAQMVEKNASKALEDKILTIVKKQICNDGSYYDSQLYKQALDCYKEVLERYKDEIIAAAAKDIADRVMRSKKMKDRIAEETKNG